MDCWGLGNGWGGPFFCEIFLDKLLFTDVINDALSVAEHKGGHDMAHNCLLNRFACSVRTWAYCPKCQKKTVGKANNVFVLISLKHYATAATAGKDAGMTRSFW